MNEQQVQGRVTQNNADLEKGTELSQKKWEQSIPFLQPIYTLP